MKKVLIIDDDEIFVYLTKKSIATFFSEIEVAVCEDGELGLRYLHAHRFDKETLPDIIFLDLSMPVMDGWEFLTEYTELSKTFEKAIQLYLVSSSISPHDVERSKQFPPVLDYIVKPFAKDKLIELMGND